MRSSRRLLLASAVVWAGCAAALPTPTSEDLAVARGRWSDVTPAQLQFGRQAYTRKCSGCHQIFEPSARTPSQWPSIVRQMASEVDLPDDEATAIERYLVTISARQEGAKLP